VQLFPLASTVQNMPVETVEPPAPETLNCRSTTKSSVYFEWTYSVVIVQPTATQVKSSSMGAAEAPMACTGLAYSSVVMRRATVVNGMPAFGLLPPAPVAPCGIVKLRTAALLVPEFVTFADVPAAPVVVVPIVTVAA